MRRNDDASRYEAFVGDELAGFVLFRRDEADRVVDLVHTEVDDRFEGHGVGSALARESLDAIREEGWQVVASCPFIRDWIERHSDYQDLVA
ncbi:MAG: N-acetyltransferase [Marmoricola sp.]|nr:N-acetyltransferase [Marmoricola sp.]